MRKSKRAPRPRGPVRTMIVINRHVILANKSKGTFEPPIRVQRGGVVIYGHRVQINGEVLLRYDPKNPLKCGATAYIEIVDGEGEATVIRFLPGGGQQIDVIGKLVKAE